MTTLNRRGLCLESVVAPEGASKGRSRRISPILAPSVLHCSHPPYVNGGSYGVGDVRCHCLSAASSRLPCLYRRQLPLLIPVDTACELTDLIIKIYAGGRPIVGLQFSSTT